MQKTILLIGFFRYTKFEVIIAFSRYAKLSLFENKSIVNFRDFFKKRVFFFRKINNFKNKNQKNYKFIGKPR